MNSGKLCSEDFLTMIFTTPILFHVHVLHTNLCLVVDRLRVSLHKHPQSRLLTSLKPLFETSQGSFTLQRWLWLCQSQESTTTTIFLSHTCLLQIVVVVDGGVGF
jgi:hypothetical protein